MPRSVLFPMIFAIAAAIAGHARTAPLEILVSQATPGGGLIHLSVFDRAESWMETPVASRVLEAESTGIASTRLDLPPATYAIALFHDAN